MATRQKFNSRFTGLAIPIVCLIILGYFGFSAFQGNLGVKSRSMMDRQSLDLQFDLTRLRQERMELQRRVALLRDGLVEKDMLDQQARYMLNLAKANELVIFKE
ncbi:MAG: septum formation initiator family protein [Rhizobiaceae bacterium]|nr:septum formation initiator family protein [Rhizobiaceae bacterium]